MADYSSLIGDCAGRAAEAHYDADREFAIAELGAPSYKYAKAYLRLSATWSKTALAFVELQDAKVRASR